ncbi:N-acetylmuramoyl-L-alanine amidase [bacterium]|nr:N-acetylmuramoyl-L-alanine amidase [bacterium]
MKKSTFKKNIIALFLIFFAAGCATVSHQPHIEFPQGIYHIVGSGETLYRIAKTYNVDIQEIVQANRITDSTQISVSQQLFIPGAKLPFPIEIYRPITQERVEKLVGPKHQFSRWSYITLHHSATIEGNAECFDRDHRIRQMGGLFYHFVIGNGTLSGDGEIEVGWRWNEQKEANRPLDIQICLVGNFNVQEVSNAQFDSLVKLINVLQKQYNIPLGNIRKHKDIEGKITECPGNNFPFYKLLTDFRNIARQ